MHKFDRRLWKRFAALVVPYWLYDEKWRARGLLLLLVVLLLSHTGCEVLLNQQSGEFTSALAAQESNRFWTSIYKSLGLLCLSVPLYAFYYYIRDRLGIQWRRWMTNNFLNRYLKHRSYYRLLTNSNIDNPDQRISEDINTFTQKSLYYLLLFASSIIQLVAFSDVLWSISRKLVGFLVVYAVLGTVITILVFGKVLIGLNFSQLKREADFRFCLMRIRENAESIAFYRGERQEAAQARQGFYDAYTNYKRLIKSQCGLNLFQYGYTSFTVVLPSMILASDVLSGEMEVGRVVQAVGAFTAVLHALAVIVENFENLSRFAAGIERLDSFSKSLDAQADKPEGANVIESVEDSRLALENVTVQTPGYQRTLVKDLSVEVKPETGLLIVGPSGGGKSSLLRAMAGLWYAGNGRILRPKPEEMLFLPQSPYMITASLRRQLLYPSLETDVPDDELYRALEIVNLPDLPDRFDGLDAELDWGKVLSLGEQQRLAMARVLLTKPQYVILDEATSALDLPNEEKLYRELRESAMTVVSVCHRPSILKFHNQVLELGGNGEWQIYSSKEYRFET